MLNFTASKWLLTCATFALLAGLLLLPRYYHIIRPTVAVSLYPLGVKVGEEMAFVDRTADVVSRRWEFGNGESRTAALGKFKYTQAGTYLVRLTATTKSKEHYARTFQVQVRPESIPLKLRLVGPDTCYQGEKVAFRTTGGNPVLFRWRPGDAAAGLQAASNEPVGIFSYQKPGRYTVTLYVAQQLDGQQTSWDSLTHPLVVKAPVWVVQRHALSRSLADSLGVSNDFQRHLQLIADGQPFNRHYRHLLVAHLAQSSAPAVLANGLLQRDFYSYCMNLHIVKGWQIDSVRVNRKPDTRQIVKLSVIQHKTP
jgi:hypothetical protein